MNTLPDLSAYLLLAALPIAVMAMAYGLSRRLGRQARKPAPFHPIRGPLTGSPGMVARRGGFHTGRHAHAPLARRLVPAVPAGRRVGRGPGCVDR
jgi:hypothetical protein